MAKTSYYTVNGQIIGERTAGVRRNYGVDALGSVTKTLTGAEIENSYAYKPYGQELQSSGVGVAPKFKWVGSQGYLTARRSFAELYVRSRTECPATGRWTSLDRLWPAEHPFSYSRNPVLQTDLSGLCIGTADVPCEVGLSVASPPFVTKKYAPLRLTWGNFCGGDAKHNPIIENPKKHEPIPDPLQNDGGVDSCCRDHDRAYIKNKCEALSNVSKICCDKDYELLLCLITSPCSPNLPAADFKKCIEFTLSAIDWFGNVKPHLHTSCSSFPPTRRFRL